MSYEEDIANLNNSLQTLQQQQYNQQSLKLAENDLEFGKEAFAQQMGLANQQFGLANQQFDWNKRVADRNYEWQKTQWDYQKQLNNLAMQREDTAFQRARADLEKAGLSPLMLSSGSGAQALNSGVAPQYDVNGVNTAYGSINAAYGAKQDALERRRQQINENRQYRFQQKQANRQLALQSASMALQVEKQVIDNIKSSQEIESNAHRNMYYREHGYQQITMATVLSDFLNSPSMKKAIDNITNWSGNKIEIITEKAPQVIEALEEGLSKEGMSEKLQKDLNLSKDEADEYVGLVENELGEPWYKASWKKIKTTARIVSHAIYEKYSRRYRE